MNPGRDERDITYVTKKKLPRNGNLNTDKVYLNLILNNIFFVIKYLYIIAHSYLIMAQHISVIY